MRPREKELKKGVQGNPPVSMDQIYDAAFALQYEDLSDEMTVRLLVRRFINLADQSVSKDNEDKIVHMILQKEYTDF